MAAKTAVSQTICPALAYTHNTGCQSGDYRIDSQTVTNLTDVFAPPAHKLDTFDVFFDLLGTTDLVGPKCRS